LQSIADDGIVVARFRQRELVQDGTAIALLQCVASPASPSRCDGLELDVAAQPVEREVERLKKA
jgi:hypothetical protein